MIRLRLTQPRLPPQRPTQLRQFCPRRLRPRRRRPTPRQPRQLCHSCPRQLRTLLRLRLLPPPRQRLKCPSQSVEHAAAVFAVRSNPLQLRLSATYWRFVFTELLKLLLVTASVVVTVGAFALALKPFADGRIGAIDAVRFMMYASVPMLQYALPFAAGFAATLVYHRLASDNELTACYAGGISHKVVLTPAITLGLVCATGLFLLSDQVIPRLLFKSQELITRDASRLISAAVNQREAIVISDAKGLRRALFAERFVRPDGPPPAPAYDYFVLTGVLATELDDQGRVLKEAAARRADVWLYRQTEQADTGAVRGVTTVVMELSDTKGSVTDRGVFDLAAARQTFRLPDALIEDPKYLSWSQMQDVQAKPELMEDLDRRRRELAAALAEQALIGQIDADLRADGAATLRDGSGRTIELRAGGLGARDAAGFVLLPRGKFGSVEVASVLSDGKVRVQRARTGHITRARAVATPVTAGSEAEAGQLRSTLDIRLAGVSTQGGGLSPAERAAQEATRGEAGAEVGGPDLEREATLLAREPAAGELAEYTLAGLTASSDPLPRLSGLGIYELLAEAEQAEGKKNLAESVSGRSLASAAGDLRFRTQDIMREINSKINERFAASLATLLTIITGAIMAMRLRDSLPLPVYLWSFLPALGALFTIAGGQSITHRQGPVGLLLLYSGIGIMLVMVLAQYRKLAAH